MSAALSLRTTGRSLLAAAALWVCAAPVSAAVIYTYTGKPFESASGTLTTSDRLVFSFTLANLLPASQTGFIASPLSWQVSAGAWSASSSSIGAILSAHQVTTDALGMVQTACFSGFVPASGGFNIQSGNTALEFLSLTSCNNPAAGPLEGVATALFGSASSDFNSGTWTVERVVDPQPMPLPGALTLVAVALLGAGANLRRHTAPRAAHG
ncbi:MAG: hypothetical protein J0L58_14905 [Burkholderiales bacterium]|uniref:hypothetical protein n=1 Tax=Inhella sp. TaxID=1921806 RepID=UPI001ACC35F2|nr:hypothetical protein [Burkholderiales bacterium]